ncbi:hypothetical protein OG500_31635 [Kitasatospora sp. NBC_01250]|uniref:hypothetical protein n=1 Tax=Kitasatospora sp. NBC_01250 TaxID=2903571 RepID=UPI002E33FC4F|nr:hypothetical protein [Kitasatospora sp. NBC_01250]
MRSKRFLLPAALGVSVLLGATACGAGDGASAAGAQASTSPSPGPSRGAGSGLASLSGHEILRQAASALESAESVRVSGTVVSGGRTSSVNLQTTLGGDCQGTVGISGAGELEIRHSGDRTWVKPDAAFWKYLAGQQGHPETGDQVARRLANRYLTGVGTDAATKQVTAACDIANQLGSELDQGSSATVGGTGTVNGVDALTVTSVDGDATGTISVATSAKP